MAYENVDWSNSSRTILDFRNVALNSQTRILNKLKNNFNVSFIELPPEKLLEVEQFFIEQNNVSSESNQLHRKKVSITNSRELSKQENNLTLNKYDNVVLIEYKLIGAENMLDMFLNPISEGSDVTLAKYLFVENKSSYHGKEIDGFKGKIGMQDSKLNKSYNYTCIFKRPKHESIDLGIKIKTQLVAKELAILFSKFIIILLRKNQCS